ncbi:hypothetical protein [Staphylococcus aureus]|uniref:hypothetical protein n=1 Tax=Staphylococcus aureus TaxID=1280 RepID=UPI001BFE8267|nr:hypothetical protein [Staphylococcus aureus]
MNKPVKVNVNEISLENVSVDQKVTIKKEVLALNSIDNLFTLVIALVLTITFVGNIVDNRYYSILMIIISLLCITTIIYIRYSRTKKKKVLKELLKQTSIFDSNQPIKIINYHEKMHAVAMYVLLISLVFSLINSALDILIK